MCSCETSSFQVKSFLPRAFACLPSTRPTKQPSSNLRMWIRISFLTWISFVISRMYGHTQTPPIVPNVFCLNNGTTTSENVEFDQIMHKGPCGKCSNFKDVRVYRETAKTLTETSTRCGLVNLLLGETMAKRCMKRVGLSTRCVDCWVENMSCTSRACTHICLSHLATSWWQGKPIASGSIAGKLNPCLECDEANCGPAFKLCAGANRRNSGIKSDIPRPETEIFSESS